MSTVTVRTSIILSNASAADLASHFKARGYDRHYAWDQFVITRDLKPEMNAGEFYAIFDVVTPSLLLGKAIEINFTATHYDKLLDRMVQITPRENGVFGLVWDFGMTGTNPPCDPPSPDRFIPVDQGS